MAVDDENSLHDDTIADAELVLRTRSGDAEAFGELWRRHYPSGMSVARSITSSIDPDDLVQESYTRIYQAIIKGGGPNGSFRAYLFTSIRNTAAAWGRSRRESAIDELDSVADPDSTEQASNEALDRSLTAQAFRSLPSRWQEVLWYTEIEQMKPNEVAPLLGMKAGAVSQLAFRAREGLREAWIQAHLRSAEPGSECQWTIEHLGAYSRGNLGTRDHKRLEQHLGECARCMIVAAEAKDVSTRLALVLLPLVLGIAGSAGYLAALQGGGTPIVALAAMPSSVIQGGVVAGSAAVGGVTAGGGTSGGGGAGSAGAGGSAGAAGGTAGGALTGIGALVGAGSAILVVAGVVAAATILPALSGASPVASLPDAAAADSSSSISTDIAPDDSMTTESPIVIETPPAEEPAPPVTDETEEQALREEAPVTTPPTTPPVAVEEPEGDSDAGSDAPSDASSEASSEAGSDADSSGASSDADSGGASSDADSGASSDASSDVDADSSADADAGTGSDADTGSEAQADTGSEAQADTGSDADSDTGSEADADAGSDANADTGSDADSDNGSDGDSDTDPGPTTPAPEEPVEVVASAVCFGTDGVTYVSVDVLGTPGADLQALLDGSTGGADFQTLAADGTATLSLRPSLPQIIFDADVQFHYVVDQTTLFPYDTMLSDLGVTLRSVLLAPACDTGAPVETVEPTTDPAPVETPASEPSTAPIDETVPEATDATAPTETTPAETTAPADTAPPVEEPTPSDTLPPVVEQPAEPTAPTEPTEPSPTETVDTTARPEEQIVSDTIADTASVAPDPSLPPAEQPSSGE